KHRIERITDSQVLFISAGPDKLVLRLTSSVPLRIDEDDVLAEFTLADADSADFLLEHVEKDHSRDNREFSTFVTDSLFRTINYWKGWVAQCRYNGRWRETVYRSALLLKLLTSYRYGSIMA